MTGTVRRVVGRSAEGPGSTACLALAIAEEARTFGFEVSGHEASRAKSRSASRYLELIDRQGRTWMIRVSDHYLPGSSGHAPPHFDLVSLDGSSGLGEARAFLLSIVAGDAAWFERRAKRHTKRRRMPNFKRFRHGAGQL